MKKNWLLKIGLTVFSIWLFCPFFTSATVFHLTWLKQIYALSPDRILDNMMYIHFADNWNDFGGFMYFSNNLWDEEDVESDEIFEVAATGHDSSYECRSQVKWFYYNAERWERLRPLDNETWSGLSEDWLQMTWWIYTLCAQSGYQAALQKCETDNTKDYNICAEEVRLSFSAGGYGYYWSIQHVYKWITGNLIMWVEYDDWTNWFISIKSGSDLSSTFVRLNNKIPVWFIYDNKWWLGLAWCMFGSGYLTWGSMKNLVREVKEKWLAEVFHPAGTWYIEYVWNLSWITCTGISFQDMLTKILIEWIMWLSNSGTWWDTKFWTIGNSSDTKMQYFATKSVSNVTMMNYVRRRAELLCRWKWMTSGNSTDTIICWDGWDLNLTWTTNWKTLIVKNGNVTISPISGSNNGEYYDIFILSGNLLINEENANKFVIDNKGFITNKDITEFKKSVIARNISNLYDSIDTASGALRECIVNGGDKYCSSWMDINNDWFTNEEDIVSLGNLGGLSAGSDKYVAVASVIRWNFIVNWNVKAASGNTLDNKYFLYGKFTTKDTIGTLENVFAWRCNNEMGSDGNFCPKFDKNPYRNASLIVIDQNYPSPLLQS